MLSDFYRANANVKEIVTVDKEPGVDYQMNNEKFIDNYLHVLKRFDIVDFDAYGNPNLLIQRFFAKISVQGDNYSKNYVHPFAITFTDGLGLQMKITSKVKYEEKFLVKKAEIYDIRHSWRHHMKLSHMFMKKVASKYGFNVRKLDLIQSPNKNYVFGAYIFTHL